MTFVRVLIICYYGLVYCCQLVRPSWGADFELDSPFESNKNIQGLKEWETFGRYLLNYFVALSSSSSEHLHVPLA